MVTALADGPLSSASAYQAQAFADRMHAHALSQGVDAFSARLLADDAQTRYQEFETYLTWWEAILRRRADEAVGAIAGVAGVAGLILTGGLARGAAWPLSDVDLVPIYDDERRATAERQVKRRAEDVMRMWAEEGGWLTHLDTSFAVTRAEVTQVMAGDGTAALALLGDHWYDALAKGERARVAADPHGIVVPFVVWCTANIADPAVVRARLEHCWERAVAAEQALRACLDAGDLVGATLKLASAVHWLKAWRLATWGQRDTSLGRWGTRFSRLAAEHGRPELAAGLDELSGLDDDSVTRRLTVAPAWVVERHAWSFRARRQAGERVTRGQAARDVLRAEGLRELLPLGAPPYPTWLGIPAEAGPLVEQADRLAAIIAAWGAEPSDATSGVSSLP